jgi:VanZ family protein
MPLTSASREGADQFENRVRHRLVREGFMPGRYRHWYPDRLDLAKHFLFYAPFGLMAGIACSVVRAAPRGSFPALLTPRRAAWALVGAGMLMASVDELRQVWVPSRSADVSDLLAGWMGIGFAFLVWKLGEKAIRISFPLCRRRLGLIPSHHQP